MLELLMAASVAIALPLTETELEGPWCLATVDEQGALIERNEQWRFEPDGVVVVESHPPDRVEGAYTINGDLIETSLALQLTVTAIGDEQMLARSHDTNYHFIRGTCEAQGVSPLE